MQLVGQPARADTLKSTYLRMGSISHVDGMVCSRVLIAVQEGDCEGHEGLLKRKGLRVGTGTEVQVEYVLTPIRASPANSSARPETWNKRSEACKCFYLYRVAERPSFLRL